MKYLEMVSSTLRNETGIQYNSLAVQDMLLRPGSKFGELSHFWFKSAGHALFLVKHRNAFHLCYKLM